MAGKRRSAAAIFCTVDGRPGRICSKCREARPLEQFRLRIDGVRCAACRWCENEANVYKRGPNRRRKVPAAHLALAAALGYPPKRSAA